MNKNLDRHIWEGWKVQDFINELEEIFHYHTFASGTELKKWCMDNQPYYKKFIPEVYEYFLEKLKNKTNESRTII